tara:strand:+ start:584 stop:1303 length:720 start_codon:yes stop_codon:yes gene_type:complete
LKTKALGKDTSNLKLKGQKLLEKIRRKKSDIKHGIDIWNVYDFLYLNNNLPSLKILEIKIPSSTLFTIESKSMKLYLNGFYNQSFKSEQTVIQQIKNDLEGFLNAKIKLSIIKKFNQEPSSIDLNNYKSNKTKINKILKFNGFRSICPVTSQPDFANIYIYCDASINTIWLIDYLISFQNKGHFHEQCIDDIFLEILNKYNCNHLEICGRFQRRGGIDINPIRGTNTKILFSNFREFNQ